MVKDATVLFSIGATKSGTSWLYRYLHSHPECHLRSVKELHYFDARDRDDCKWQAGRFRKYQREIQSIGGEDANNHVADYQALIGLLDKDAEDIAGYLSYLDAGRDDELVVADVTPAYSLLSAQRFSMMAKISGDVKFIYILRDPVARLWSHIRMKARRREGPSGTAQEWANRIFWRIERGKNQGILARGNYREVLENLRMAVAQKRYLVIFYEDLFTNSTVDRICAFLGIGSHRANLLQAVNPGPVLLMTEKQLNVARHWLSDQYDYVRAHFDNLPEAWQANMIRVEQ